MRIFLLKIRCFLVVNAPLRNQALQFMNGKAPLFVPQVRGSLDFARDDGALFSRHFDQVKRVEKSPKAKQWLCNEIRP